MSDAVSYADRLEAARRVLYAFDLNVPIPPEDDGRDYVCPAESYLQCVEHALALLTVAQLHACDEIPEQIKARAEIVGKTAISATEEMATVEPEMRRYWAVKAAQDLVRHLYDALHDEARPQRRVVLPKLSKQRE